jgi:hypothetical protein
MAVYLIAYGHCIRCERANMPGEAMRLAYGMEDSDRMTLRRIPGLARAMSKKAVHEHQRQLAIRHFNRTGKICGGWDNEPEIKNRHWTTCQLCRIPIISEPADMGVNEVCCVACELRLSELTEAEIEEMSSNKIRERLRITIHHSPCEG